MERAKKFILLIVILIGTVLRIHYALNNAYFVNDQGRDLFVLEKMLQRKYPITIGPSTSFFTKYGNLPFGPYYYYFLFPFFLVSKHPYFIMLVFVILYILISLFILQIQKINFAEKLIFLLFFSFSLNSISHTTFIWNLNLALLLGFLLYLVFIEKNSSISSSKFLTFIFSFLLGAVFQMHYALFFLVTVIGFYFFKLRKFKFFLLGLSTSFFPFLIFELRHNFLLSKMLFQLPFETQENNLNINILQSFIDLSKFYFPFLTENPLFHLINGIFLTLFVLKFAKKFYSKSLFSIFFLSFILLKRKFNYYLALYLPFFYFQLSCIKNKKIKKLIWILVILTSIFSLNRYLNENYNKFGIKTQINIAKEILKHNWEKNTISLIAKPHPDDKKGVEYLLSVVYKVKIDDKAKDKYIICYEKKLCDNKSVIFEDKKIRVIYKRE